MLGDLGQVLIVAATGTEVLLVIHVVEEVVEKLDVSEDLLAILPDGFELGEERCGCLFIADLFKLEHKSEDVYLECQMVFHSMFNQLISLLSDPIYKFVEILICKSYFSCVLVHVLCVLHDHLEVFR